MSFLSYFWKFFYPARRSNDDFVNDSAPLSSSSINKRCQEGILDDVTTVKRRKIFQSTSDLNILKKTSVVLNKEHKENNAVLMRQNSRTNCQVFKLPVSKPRKHDEIYCIDNDEDSSVGKRTLKECNKNRSVNKFNSPSNTEVRSELLSSYSTTVPCATRYFNGSGAELCLPKVRSLQGKFIYLDLLKNHASVSIGKRPLTVDAKHNKNNHTSRDSSCNRSYPCYRMSTSVKNNLSVQKMESRNPNENFYFDNHIIDLTSDENDEDERQIIESNVICSSSIKNLKSNFVGNDCNALNEDYISDILKKYDTKIQNMKSCVTNIEKVVRKNDTEFYKTLADILDKRLTLKDHSESVEDVYEQPPSYKMAPITKPMIAEINQITSSKKIPLARVKDTNVKLEDIRTLENTAWLNDEVINAYMNLIKLRAENNAEKYPKVHCFNTFLYEQLCRKGYSSVRRWTKKIDIFDFQILIVPIHLRNHWCLIEISFKRKHIRYYDSMGSSNNNCLKIIMQYLVDEYQDKKKEGMFDTSSWKLINVPNDEIPLQKNVHDCGVFACTYAEHITRNASFNFSQEDMPYFRIKMMYEILTGSLLL